MNTENRILKVEDLRAEANPWPPPTSFEPPDPPSIPLNEAIPPTLARFREFILAVSRALQVSADAVAGLAMALVSLAAARAFEVQLLPQWIETAPLWVIVLAEPGERKSALLAALTGPLHRWQANEHEKLKLPLAAYNARRSNLDAQLTGLRRKLVSANDLEAIRTLELDIRSLTATLAKMPALLPPELVTADATPEAMRDLLVRNGEKLALVSGETDAGQLMGSRYSDGPNISMYLSAFTGEPVAAHRVGRDMPLHRPSLAMALAVQPEALASVLSDPVAQGRGLVARMLIIRPKSRMGSRELSPPAVPLPLLEWWNGALCGVLDCPWLGRVVIHDVSPLRSEAPAKVLGIDAEAAAVFTAFRSEIESKLGEDGDLRPISGFASKLPGVVARLALCFQVLEDVKSGTVAVNAMKAASAWAPFLIAHHLAVRGDTDEPTVRRHARRLIAAFVRHQLRDVSARKCFTLIDNECDMSTMEDILPVLDLLESHHYLRESPKPEKGVGRPPSTQFQVNPAIFHSA